MSSSFQVDANLVQTWLKVHSLIECQHSTMLQSFDVLIGYMHCNLTHKLHIARQFICTVVQKGLVLHTVSPDHLAQCIHQWSPH